MVFTFLIVGVFLVAISIPTLFLLWLIIAVSIMPELYSLPVLLATSTLLLAIMSLFIYSLPRIMAFCFRNKPPFFFLKKESNHLSSDIQFAIQE